MILAGAAIWTLRVESLATGWTVVMSTAPSRPCSGSRATIRVTTTYGSRRQRIFSISPMAPTGAIVGGVGASLCGVTLCWYARRK